MLDLTRFRKRSTQAVAAFMALWLSGGILIFCCPNIHGHAMPDSCPMAKASHHCDKAGKTNINAAAIGGEAACVNCCGFIPVLFDKTRKVEPAHKQVQAPVLTVILKSEAPVVAIARPQPIFFRARLPDKQGIFIQNRVLRI